MLCTYLMNGKTNGHRREKKDVYEALALLLQHMDGLEIDIKTISFFNNGTVQVTTTGKIREDQLEHLGIDPMTEKVM